MSRGQTISGDSPRTRPRQSTRCGARTSASALHPDVPTAALIVSRCDAFATVNTHTTRTALPIAPLVVDRCAAPRQVQPRFNPAPRSLAHPAILSRLALTLHSTLFCLTLLVAAESISAQSVFGDRTVGRVQTSAGPGSGEHPLAPVAGRRRCIGVDHVAGAIVFGDRAVELSMSDGARWRMVFAQSCPALSFYQGFYYRRAIAGRLCAGRDAVIARSGGECLIGRIILVRKPTRRR